MNGLSDGAAALALSHVVLAVPLLPIVAVAAWRHGGLKNIQKHLLLGLGVGVLLCVLALASIWGIGLIETRHSESTALAFFVVGLPLGIWIVTSNVAGHLVPYTDRWMSAASAIATGSCLGFGSPALLLFYSQEVAPNSSWMGFEDAFWTLQVTNIFAWALAFTGTWFGAARATRHKYKYNRLAAKAENQWRYQ